jgi:hypothetical protein
MKPPWGKLILKLIGCKETTINFHSLTYRQTSQRQGGGEKKIHDIQCRIKQLLIIIL